MLCFLWYKFRFSRDRNQKVIKDWSE